MQPGERLNGIQEVSGSIPLISTKENLETTTVSRLFFFSAGGKRKLLSNTFLTGWWSLDKRPLGAYSRKWIVCVRYLGAVKIYAQNCLQAPAE